MAQHPEHVWRAFEARAHSDLSFFERVRRGVAWLSDWWCSCADHYAAALLYDTLSRLSDRELEGRGLQRDTLARDLIAAQRVATSRGGRS